MAREPSYPDDSPVGTPVEKTAVKDGGGPEGKVAGDKAEGSRPAEKAPGDKGEGARRTRHIVTGAAIGVGSAALVAALLYANRSRKGGTDESR